MGTWSTPNLGLGSVFVPNYRSDEQMYVIKIPTLYDSNEEHEAPVSESKLGIVYNLVFCSDLAKNPYGEPKNQLIKLPKQYGADGYNSERITYRHLVSVYQVLYGMPTAMSQPQSR